MKSTLIQAMLVCLIAVLPMASMAEEKGAEKLHTEAALKLFEAMQLNITYEKSIESTVDMQIKSNPAIGPYRKVMLEFFSKYMSWNSLKDDMAQIYVEIFTIQELQELTAFYTTPVGKKAALLMPQLMTKGGELGIKRVQDNMAELQIMIAEEDKRIAEERISNR